MGGISAWIGLPRRVTHLVEAIGHNGSGHAEQGEARGAGAGQAPRKADGGEPASWGAILQDRQVLHGLQGQGASCWAGCQAGQPLHSSANSLRGDGAADCCLASRQGLRWLQGQGVQGCEAGPSAAHGRLCKTCSWTWVEPDCRSAPVLHRLQGQGMQVVRQDQAARTAGAARHSSAGDAASLHDVKQWSRPTAGQGRTGAQPGAGCNGFLAGTEQVVLSVL